MKYADITQSFRERMLSGGIKPGGKLPSIREVAKQFACGKNTVIRAFQELEKEHMIYAKPKSGYYAVNRAVRPETRDDAWIDFAIAAPGSDIIPYRDLAHCMSRAAELYGDSMFDYGEPLGSPTLRFALSRHFAASQVFAKPEQIAVVSGSQQALHILAEMPFPNGKSTVLVEQPSYAGMLRTLELQGVPAAGIARGETGIDLDELERVFRDKPIKFFYCMPRFHNPLGTSLSEHQKKAVARLAAKYDVYIVEDDYLADLETDSRADSVFSCDQSAHTVHLRSFSKIMLPGLRLGAAILPPALVAEFRNYKRWNDIGTSTLSQAALEVYLDSGMYGHHAGRMRARYKSRMDTLRASGSLFDDGSYSRLIRPAGGLFAHLQLQGSLTGDEAAAALRESGVGVFPTGPCYLPGTGVSSGIRISIIRTSEPQIETGMLAIRDTIRELLNRRRSSLGSRAVQWI